MRFGQVLEEVIDHRGETQAIPAGAAHVSDAYISKIVRGKRQAPMDVMKNVAIHYDEPKLSLAAMEEVSGGACVPWLDRADLHKSTVLLKTEEETREAYEAMAKTRSLIIKNKDQLTQSDLDSIRTMIMECIEAITALTHCVAVLCKEYMFSWISLWKEHRRELKSKKYLN